MMVPCVPSPSWGPSPPDWGQQERPKIQRSLPKAPEPLTALDRGRTPRHVGTELQKDNLSWMLGVVWGAGRSGEVPS